MTEKPIMFSGEMVRAILDGRKTQTRRVIRLPESAEVDREKGTYSWAECGYSGQDVPLPKCPYGVPGDRLWVRETWRETGVKQEPYAYREDEESLNLVGEQDQIVKLSYRWRQAGHMPLRASRITLEVTGVRVERLQEIAEEDAQAEGFKTKNCQYPLDEPCRHCQPCPANIIAQFKAYWDSINAKRPGCSWEDNPWVFVVEFKRV